MLAAEPNAIQLRYLQTLTEIAGDNTNTIVFPLDLVEKAKQAFGGPGQ
jgi:regulator of protease activity HflC (stomatin/prohibitin superfamily)